MVFTANGEFGDPLDPPKSPPGPGPAQKRLWEALGQPLEGLEELWESSGRLYMKTNSRSTAQAAVMLHKNTEKTTTLKLL